MANTIEFRQKKNEARGIRGILGTSQDSIDIAEDRDRFQQLISDLQLKQPHIKLFIITINQFKSTVSNVIERIGYPVVVRPSYVLGGAAMKSYTQMMSWMIISILHF